MASLARAVPSLARAVPSLARTVLKPSDLPPRGTRRPVNLSPVAGANGMLPYGVPFESLIFYILPHLRFLGFKLTSADRPFFSPSIFYPPWGTI